MHRRDFIRTTTALAGSFMASRFNFKAAAQAPPKIRKSITELAPDAPELVALKQAVKAMRDLNKSTDRKSWNEQANIHFGYCPHENWWFLPWHRAYLHFFERICQMLSTDSFALPYWDWTRYPNIPAPFLDKTGSLGNETRGSDSRNQISSESVGQQAINSLLSERAIVQVYGGRIDNDDQILASTSSHVELGPHNGVHSAVGGDMLGRCSPEDPLFWVHHCNIDRLWTSWQALHGGVVPDDKLWGNHKLEQFYDPDLKAPRLVPCSETVTSAEFIPQYDRLETLAGGTPSVPLPAQQIWLGPGGQVTLPAGLAKAVISETHASVRNNMTMFSLPLSGEFQRMLSRASYLRPDNYQNVPFFVFLLLDDVPFPRSLSTRARVFLNPTNTGNALRLDDPAYVQTLSFFAVNRDEKHKTTFAFDITPNIVQLAAMGHIPRKKVEFTLFSLDPAHPQEIAEPVRPAKARVIVIG
jgi:tyrosinase